MKKIIWTGLLILTACTTATPELTPIPLATATRVTPTLIPATDTPTAIPSPTSTSTPLLPKQYFTEEFDSPLTYWSVLYASGEASSVDVRSENSSLSFELSASNTWLYAIYSGFEYEGVHLETSVENRGSDVNTMGLVCNYNESEGWYEFNISSDGEYSVLYGQWLADGIAHYIPIVDDTSEYIQTGNAINEISLDCYEGILELHINGKPFRKLDVSRFELSKGKVGFTLSSFSEVPVILSFDWVEVSEP